MILAEYEETMDTLLSGDEDEGGCSSMMCITSSGRCHDVIDTATHSRDSHLTLAECGAQSFDVGPTPSQNILLTG